VNRDQRLLADRHSATRIFIEHPGWEDDLVTIREFDLNDIKPETGAGANYAYAVAEVRKVGIVNARGGRKTGSA
jgi:hypothetical protein